MSGRRGRGVADEEFVRGRVPMTKMEVRAVTLAKARLREDARVLDVGAGTGGLTVDAALACPAGHVVAVERDGEALGLLRENVRRLATGNVTVVDGEAPAVFTEIDGRFDAVLVGGSGGKLQEILEALPALLVHGGVVVANTVGFHSTSLLLDALARDPWEGRDCVQVSVSRIEPLAGDLRLVPLNPVWVTSARMREGRR